MERVILRHGVPAQLLSNCGAAFLSKLLTEVYRLIGIKKVNTTAYHPQTNGLVEWSNCTLLDMLSKTARMGRTGTAVCHLPTEPAHRLPRENLQSTYYMEETLGCQLKLCRAPNALLAVEADDYITELTRRMSEAWSLARDAIKKAQMQREQQHDVQTRSATFEEDERVFVFMPAAKSGKACKLVQPFHGPYCVVHVVEKGIEARPVDQPHATPTRVALN